ncbi:tetratricopeptide repeat-containing sensor histidine kinase [uncultured Aquimarina sp.]|uniref:ATP-binding protein n=1 Tax=uncultured Aquimarina sp. TaxID=575652 RepID=UPI00262B460F|nr:tetratricopeptide repeat-containing sensor histidine kinase [uncultured Aquimarina sp.]
MILHKPYFLIIIIFLAVNVYAQTPEGFCEQYENQHDTIQNLDKKIQFCHKLISKVDPECKIKLYLHLGQFYGLKRKIDSSLYSYDQAIKLGKSLKTEELLSLAYVYKAYKIAYNYNNSKNEEVIILLEEARKILSKDSMNKAWSQYYGTYSKIAEENIQLQKSLKYLDSAIIVNKRMKDTNRLSTSYHNRGVGFLNLSDYESASQDLIQSIKLANDRDKPNLSQIASSYYVLGACYIQGGEQYETAKKYIKKGIAISKKIGNDYLTLLNYSLLSESYQNLKENEEALNAADSSLFLARKLDDKIEIAQAMRDKGRVYLDNLKDLDKAEKHFLESYEITMSSNNYDDTHIYPSLQGLIDVYLQKEDYSKAKKYLQDFEDVTNNLGSLSHQKEMHKAHSEYYEKVGQSTKALEHFKKYNVIKDSISNSEMKTEIADLEKKYDTKSKELDIVKLTKEKEEQQLVVQKAKAQQNLYLLAACFLLLLLGIGAWAFRKLRKQQKELTSTNQVKNRLFSIIAHDLRGMIIPFQRSGKILKHHIDKGNHEKTIELSQALEQNSESLSNMLDNLLNWSLEQMNGYKMNLENLSIKEELSKIILGYEQQATYKKTKIELEYQNDFNIKFDRGAFHVIFRNLIGNALKYTEGGNIRIKFTSKNDMFLCSVIDTGVGMSKDQLENLFTLEEKKSTVGTQGEKGTGLGLNLVYRFVKMYKGTIQVSSEKRIGTRFDLSMPITISLTKEDGAISKPLSA